MIVVHNSKLVRFGTRVLQNKVQFILEMVTDRFPNKLSDSYNEFILGFSANTTVNLDYGNGEIINYATVNRSFHMRDYIASRPDLSVAIPTYIYPDGLNISRRITITIPNKDLLQKFVMNQKGLAVQPLRLRFDEFKNLFSLEIYNGSFSSIDESYLRNERMTEIVFENAFSSKLPYYSKIPEIFFSRPLKKLWYRSLGMYGKNHNETNLDKVYLLASSLEQFRYYAMGLTDAMGLPATFNQLTKLWYLAVQANLFTKMPDVVNEIPSITQIFMNNSDFFTDFGYFPNLVNLRYMSISRCDKLKVPLPAWFNQLVSLKDINYAGCGIGTPGKLDAWVQEMYNFVTINAAMTGTSSNPFRSMVIGLGENVVGDGTAIPTGIYQQPAGYIQGSNNGNPVSSLERIWVMVNQYGHTWSYRKT